MTKKRRLQFKCWKCDEEFGMTREIVGHPKLRVECPFCEAECVTDLAPYRTEPDKIFRGSEPRRAEQTETVLNLPDVLPTRQPTSNEVS